MTRRPSPAGQNQGVDATPRGDQSAAPDGAGRRRVAGWTAAAAIVLVALTVIVLAHPAPLPGEVRYVGFLQRLAGPVPSVARFVRRTTGTEASVALAVPAGFWLITRYGRAGGGALAVALLAMLVLQPVYKELVDRPRPTVEQVEVRAHHTSKSFPSGHSLSTTTVWGAAAALAWRHRRRPVAGVLALPIVLTGLASAVQGVHWPSDALAGTLAGALAAVVIVRVLGPPPAPA